MNMLALFLSTFLVASAPSNGFVKPINKGEEKIKTMKLINLVDLASERRFVKVANDPVSYDELRYYAIHECKNNKDPDRALIDMLIEVEKSFNPPSGMRGMLLAAACMESGYNPFAKGDRKFSKNRKPMAIGIVQQWPIYEKMYPGLDRENPQQAATAWMKHIVKMIPKVKRQCRYKTANKIWLAAWVTGIRYKKAGGRCNERPLHFRLLKKWHRSIKNDRRTESYCRDRETCGC